MSIRLILTLLLPFFYVPAAYEVRELPRQTLAVLLALVALWTPHGRVPERARAVGWLLGVVLLASVGQSDEPTQAWFGPFPAGPATLGWLAYLVVLLCPPPTRERRAWLNAFVALGAMQGAIGIVQALALSRVPSGTLGHPVFLGALCSAAFVAGQALLLDDDGPPPLWLVAAVALSLAGVASSGRRAAILVTLVIALGLLAVRRTSPKLAAVLVLGLVLAALPLLTPLLNEPAPLVARLVGEAEAMETIDARLHSYTAAASFIAERPWLGWGAGAFRELYASQAPLSGRYVEGRVHNLALEVGMAAGGLGLVALAIALAVWLAVARRQPSDRRPLSVERLSAAAAVASYAAHLAVNFDVPALGVWVATLGGFLLSDAHADLTPPRRGRRLLLSLGLSTAALPLWSGLTLGHGLARARAGDVGAARAAYDRAAALGNTGCLAALLAARLDGPAGSTAAAERIIRRLRRCLDERPRDAFAHYALGTALLDGRRDLAAARAALQRAVDLAPGEPQFRSGLARALRASGQPRQALAVLDAALVALGDEAALYNDRGVVWSSLGQPELAAADFRRAAELSADPRYYDNLVNAARAAPPPRP